MGVVYNDRIVKVGVRFWCFAIFPREKLFTGPPTTEAPYSNTGAVYRTATGAPVLEVSSAVRKNSGIPMQYPLRNEEYNVDWDILPYQSQ